MIPGGLAGTGGDGGAEQMEASAEDGDTAVVTPSVKDMLWGVTAKKSKTKRKKDKFYRFPSEAAELARPQSAHAHAPAAASTERGPARDTLQKGPGRARRHAVASPRA